MLGHIRAAPGRRGVGERRSVARRFDACRLELGTPADLPRFPQPRQIVAVQKIGPARAIVADANSPFLQLAGLVDKIGRNE